MSNARGVPLSYAKLCATPHFYLRVILTLICLTVAKFEPMQWIGFWVYCHKTNFELKCFMTVRHNEIWYTLYMGSAVVDKVLKTFVTPFPPNHQCHECFQHCFWDFNCNQSADSLNKRFYRPRQIDRLAVIQQLHDFYSFRPRSVQSGGPSL